MPPQKKPCALGVVRVQGVHPHIKSIKCDNRPASRDRRVILEIDATLLTADSEKEGAAGTYKRGFGFHPLLCFEVSVDETISGTLKPATPSEHREGPHSAPLAQLPENAPGPGTLVKCDSTGTS